MFGLNLRDSCPNQFQTRGTQVPTSFCFLYVECLFFNQFWWIHYPSVLYANRFYDVYRFSDIQSHNGTKIKNFLSLIMIRFFWTIDFLWNILHASFKYIWPSSYGVRDRKVKGSLKFIWSLNLHSVFFHEILFQILLCGIFQKNCCNSYLIWDKKEPKWTKF